MKFNEFGQPDFGDYSSRKIVLSKDGKPARFQIPRLYMPFGISGFTPDVGQKKWNIDFSLKGFDEDGDYEDEGCAASGASTSGTSVPQNASSSLAGG
jgi:hypothetical protein